MMTEATYTVVGLIDLDTSQLLVAAVLPGEIHAVDTSPTEGRQYQRWCGSFIAMSPAHAETLARETVEAR